MRFICIADTHLKDLEGFVPPGDVLIHAGDLTFHGNLAEMEAALSEIQRLKFPHVIAIAGNHDRLCERRPLEEVTALFQSYGVIYLQDNSTELNGLKIYGSPWTTRSYRWAFHAKEGIERHWQKIPNDCDVVVTHAPPYGILDQTLRGTHFGCKFLAMRIAEIKPRLHVFGHLHPSYGVVETADTTFANASLCDSEYNPINEPVVVDL